MLNRLRRRRPRPASVSTDLVRSAEPTWRPELAAADRTEEAAALLFVNRTALALGRAR